MEQEAAEETESMMDRKASDFSATFASSCSKSIWLRPPAALGNSWFPTILDLSIPDSHPCSTGRKHHLKSAAQRDIYAYTLHRSRSLETWKPSTISHQPSANPGNLARFALRRFQSWMFVSMLPAPCPLPLPVAFERNR
jgi:hypothetical protein